MSAAVMTGVMAAAGGAEAGLFLGWGPFMISIGNLIVIVAMLVLFAAALVLPFPSDRGE